jgi:hypothetical protein
MNLRGFGTAMMRWKSAKPRSARSWVEEAEPLSGALGDFSRLSSQINVFFKPAM